MVSYRVFTILILISALSFAGCGDSNEPTTIEVGEVQQYVNENAAQLADEDAVADAEEAAEDAEAAAEDAL